MALFYFDLHECGTILADLDGVDIADVAAARSFAVNSARDIMSGEVKGGTLCLSCFIEILDDKRERVERIMFRDAIEVSGL